MKLSSIIILGDKRKNQPREINWLQNCSLIKSSYQICYDFIIRERRGKLFRKTTFLSSKLLFLIIRERGENPFEKQHIFHKGKERKFILEKPHFIIQVVIVFGESFL